MSSIPNSKPFASWDPLLQMLCGPLSTKAMQRTSHFWWNNEGHEMMELDNGKVMINKSCQILQSIKMNNILHRWRDCVWDLLDFHPGPQPPSLEQVLKFRRSHTQALLLYLQTNLGLQNLFSYSKNTWELVAPKLTTGEVGKKKNTLVCNMCPLHWSSKP
jgi:hypothetical protein